MFINSKEKEVSRTSLNLRVIKEQDHYGRGRKLNVGCYTNNDKVKIPTQTKTLNREVELDKTIIATTGWD